jgi:hypothetical protein
MTRVLKHWVLSLTVLALASATGQAMAFGFKPATKTQATPQATVQGLSAETVNLASSLTEEQTSDTYGKSQSKTYSIDLKGRWGVKIDVNQTQSRPSGWSDVDAGAFFKVTPALRVGGTVGFGPKTNSFQPSPAPSPKVQPRVRVETNFKF